MNFVLFIWFVSTVWSGLIVSARIYWRKGVHNFNVAWFVLSLALFLMELGVFNK